MVCVEIDRNLYGSLQCLNEVICFLRAADTGHVLDADRVNAHLLELLTHFCVLLNCVNRACCIADTALSVLTALQCLINSYFDISEVIKCVEDSEDIHAVLGGLSYEESYDVIGIMLVT